MNFLGAKNSHSLSVGYFFLLSVYLLSFALPAWSVEEKADDDGEGDGVTIILQKTPENYIPKGGAEDNTVQITATATGATGQFKFTLYNVSDEPGYCMNAPQTVPNSGEDSNSWKDLQFISQGGYTISGDNNSVATTTSDNLDQATVTVKAFDYGAYGRIKVEFTPKDRAKVYIGAEEGSANAGERKEYTTIPRDSNGNFVADSATQNIGPGTSYDASDDLETDPLGRGGTGDVFTRYQEYRGFMHNSIHIRTKVDQKTVFIWQESPIGIGYFGDLGFEVYPDLATIETQASGDYRKINFNQETTFTTAAFAIRLRNNVDLVGMSGRTVGGRKIYMGVVCEVNVPYINSQGTAAHLDLAIAHELGHAVSLTHPNNDSGYYGGHGNNENNRKNCIMNATIFFADPAPTTFCNDIVRVGLTIIDSYVCQKNHAIK